MRDKSMLGAGFGPALCFQKGILRRFISYGSDSLGANNRRSRGNPLHSNARLCAPYSTECRSSALWPFVRVGSFVLPLLAVVPQR